MLMHQTLSKGWCHARSRLLLGLIVRVGRRLVEAQALFGAAQSWTSGLAYRDPEVITLAFPQPSSGPASEASEISGALLMHICAPTSRTSVPKANSTAGCALWSPICVTSSVQWPERSVASRRSTISWTPLSSRPS
jgi:hypothetical protein